ncbi:hypothetical protein D7V64_15535 [Acinetobacter cumulans]|uniref:Surface-adhesin protein E-like domain-containing protein n=1 Tax=Acinetobacter cumulans TaxID=2136182 RepID=A0A3A8G3R5_9GAMM|nr:MULTISPECIES: surface-adhesin E family protein [Acinetobacter]RKG48321.1 hypothetical protein D7V64_15535 [Acinetobacter cumulans]CAD9197134.1 hypothetical protein QAC21B_03303 [Acinetobacter bohemicus]
MIKKLLYCLLILPSFAQAEWEFYSEDNERNYYFDYNRVKVTDINLRYITYWTKSIYHSDLVKDTIYVNDYYLTLYYGNCSESTLAIKTLALYNKKGDLRYQNTVPTKYNPVLPDSRGEVLLEKLCRYAFN